MAAEPRRAATAAEAAKARYHFDVKDLAGLERFLGQGGRADRIAAYADLALAWACAQNEPQALKVFEDELLAAVPPALRALDQGTGLTDEVLQRLRVRFFVDRPPLVLEYLGKGALAGWVRMAAVHLALDVVRGRGAKPNAQEALEHLADEHTQEKKHLQAEAVPKLKEAFLRAFDSLSSRERAVLRLHVVDGASIDQIAAVYEIHRATAARWVVAVREALQERTQQLFAQATQSSPDEVESLMRSLVSQLDVSLERRLQES